FGGNGAVGKARRQAVGHLGFGSVLVRDRDPICALDQDGAAVFGVVREGRGGGSFINGRRRRWLVLGLGVGGEEAGGREGRKAGQEVRRRREGEVVRWVVLSNAERNGLFRTGQG